MTQSSPNLQWLAIAAAGAMLATASVARADVIDEATTACKAKSTAAQIDQFLTSKDMRSYHRLVDTKTRIGDCKPLKAHTEVKIDKNEGDLACVKAKGDSRCAWVLEAALRITTERHEPVRQDYFACRTTLYLDTGRKIMAGNDPDAAKRFRFATNQSGQCLTLRKGEAVDVEKRKNKEFCVRPPGEDECFWTDSLALPPNI